SAKMQVAFVAPAPQPVVSGELSIAPSGSLASEIPIAREGTPKAEVLDIHPRIDAAELPQVAIATLPVAPVTGAEVQAAPAQAQSEHIASKTSKPAPISIGGEASSNPIGSVAVLDQASAPRLPLAPSLQISDPFAVPQLDIKPPAPSAGSIASSDVAIAPDFVEPPRPSTQLGSS